VTPIEFRNARQNLGLTQVEMGQLLCRNKSIICRWETGKCPIDPLAVEYLALLRAYRAAIFVRIRPPEGDELEWAQRSAKELDCP
jgi:DNA-binding transcriptional regulator YiaG